MMLPGVLIVDPTARGRSALGDLVAGRADMRLVGTVSTARIARRKLKQLEPAAVTLHIDSIEDDNVSLLVELRKGGKTAIVVMSCDITPGSVQAVQLRGMGAIDVLPAPRNPALLRQIAEVLPARLSAGIRKIRQRSGERAAPRASGAETASGVWARRTEIIAIGASTGGPQAVLSLLSSLPPGGPPIVYSQHLPLAQSRSYVRRLDRASAMHVHLARTDEPLRRGHVYVAPGDQHLIVVRRGAQLVAELTSEALVNGHRPSVDVLFQSVARAVGANAVAVLLTGMGKDGAQGMLELRTGRAETIAQDQASSVVWGMPGASVKNGGAGKVLSLEYIADELVRAA